MVGDIVDKTEEKYVNTCTALIRKYGVITTEQQKDLKRAFYESWHKPETLEKFVEKSPMSISETIDAINIINQYNIGFDKIMLFHKNGYTMVEASNMIELKKSLEHFSIIRRDGTPDLSDWTSYHNLLFLDEISGNHHDTEAIKDLISKINDKLKETESDLGMAEIIYKMKEIYPNFRYNMPETLIDITLNNITNLEESEDISYLIDFENED